MQVEPCPSPDDGRARSDDAPRAEVVLADDHELVRGLTATVLRGDGWVVHEARTADEALALLRAHPAARVLVTDVAMPGGRSGLELLRALRHDEDLVDLAGVAVVVMTGLSSDRASAFGAIGRAVGADAAGTADDERGWLDVVLKPFSIDDLTATVRRAAANGTR